MKGGRSLGHRDKEEKSSEEKEGPRSPFPLRDRPGFLIRRLHQIHVAIFFEECAQFEVTPVQYSVLSALREHGQFDQISLAREIGIDRTNVADVLRRLESRGLVVRTQSTVDRRIRHAELSPEGVKLVKEIAAAARAAHERTIEPLPKSQRAAFVEALHRLVDANNNLGRAPLKFSWTRDR